MKVVNVFAQIFAIFTFLTLGSLLLLVSLHVLSVEDAIFKIREIYAAPAKSVQLGIAGLLCILVGLVFSKMLVKKGRESEAIMFQSEMGPVVVSVTAIEDVAKKVLKRFHRVKDWKLKTLLHHKDVEMKLRLVLWAGGEVPKLLKEIQDEICKRLRRLLGSESKFEIICDVHHIEDHELEVNDGNPS